MLINEIHFNRNGRNYRLYTHGHFLMMDEWVSGDGKTQVAHEYSFRIGEPLFKILVDIGMIVFRNPGITPVTQGVYGALADSSTMTTAANIEQLLNIIKQVGNIG